MASLTKEEWDAARAMWCADERAGFGWMVPLLGDRVSRQAISKKATKDGWEKVAQPGKEVAPATKAQPAQPKQPAKSKAPVTPPPPPSAPESGRMSPADWQLATGKRPVGRPSEYRDEFVSELISFFDIQVQSAVDVDELDKDGKTVTRKQIITNAFPTLTRFAANIGVTRQTLHEWATEKVASGDLRRPEFAYAYARAKDAQESLLVEGGMGGVYEPRFAVFAAKNLAGWKDQIETTGEVMHTMASTEELDNFYAAGAAQMQANRAKVLERQRRAAGAEDVEVRG